MYMLIDLCLGLWALDNFLSLDFGYFLYGDGMVVKMQCLGQQNEGLLKPKRVYFSGFIVTLLLLYPVALPLFVQSQYSCYLFH